MGGKLPEPQATPTGYSPKGNALWVIGMKWGGGGCWGARWCPKNRQRLPKKLSAPSLFRVGSAYTRHR